MRENRPSAAFWLALLLMLAPLVGCHPQLDAARSAREASSACDGEARGSMVKPPPSPPAAASQGAPAPGGGAEREAVTHFGIFTPVFPAVGGNALDTRCDPNDFYGGCL